MLFPPNDAKGFSQATKVSILPMVLQASGGEG